MTVINTQYDYLERPYLITPYMTSTIDGNMGQQAKFIIADQFPAGMQVEIVINTSESQGQQAELFIIGAGDDFFQGQQAKVIIEGAGDDFYQGQQVDFQIDSPLDDFYQGQQANLIIFNGSDPNGMEAIIGNIVHANKPAYLLGDYLSGAYLAGNICASGGHQANMIIVELEPIGQQAELFIVGAGDDYFQGQQAKFIIEDELAIGQQVEIKTLTVFGMQVNVSLYNTTNLRILCDFPSRGLEGAAGNNAWGNPAGTGQNWKANSTETGDFLPSNVNTDIVEQVWRSNSPATTGLQLDCDTERAQGVFLDTLAILNHNMTTSASITLIGSNTDDFSVVGISIPLAVSGTDPNIYYLAPSLPNNSYRYWRISIDDGTNGDGYVQIGTIIFGASRIFFGECFVDEIEFQLKDYADSVATEGFTNVKNSRAQKKTLRLDFRSLDFTRGNFQLMRSIFQYARTTLKCLWIPTPDPTDQEYTARFAVFSKLTQVPVERHNNKGREADYVSFTLDLDESE